MTARLAGLWVVVVIGCSRPIQIARMSAAEPEHPVEREAAERVAARRCGTMTGLLFPGVPQLCLHKPGEAALLASLGAAELGTAVAVADSHSSEHPGVALPLLALQDLWVYSNADAHLEAARAERALYAPRDSLADVLAAPLNLEVLGRADVWAGTLAVVAAGVGVSLLLHDTGDFPDAGNDPDLFGHEVDRRVGYPLGVGSFGALFGHVAIAEEALFRGVIHSGIARRGGERAGWLWGSLIFGLAHSLNALALPPEDRTRYLVYAVPVITVVGSAMGHAYRRSGYSLSVPVAMHFWYDVLLSTTLFVLEPQTSPLSASITLPF